VPERVAVKTGTSSGFRDGWCVGFTGKHTVAVWAGNFDGHPMGELLSVRSAAPLWRTMIDYLLHARHDPAVPDAITSAPGLVAVSICPLTGLLPAAIGPEPPVREYFLPGTEPTEDASHLFVADPQGGSARLLLPPEYAAWCRSVQNGINAIARSPDGLAITSPPDGASFSYDPNLPPAQQMIELSTNAPNPQAVRWTANGQPITPDRAGRTYWKLSRGEWDLRAEDGDAIATSHIAVE
jgi:penicillin-binding protein 1C